ncbi:MAG: hypothetical protein HKN26_13395 [Acidimicrobiales bacterium]|nr:hypothetical protein [Acidimicrobiales bacterium]
MAPTRLLLHIGTAKTGTSTLQAFLRQNESALAAVGVYYPPTPEPRMNHSVQANAAVRPPAFWPRVFKTSFPDPAPVQAQADDFFADLRARSSPDLTVLSSEYLAGFRVAKIYEFLDVCGANDGTATAVCYVREPTQFWASSTSQRLKSSARVQNPLQGLLDGYNVVAKLRHWEECIGRDRLIVRAFEPHQLVGGDICGDFLGVLGGFRPLPEAATFDRPGDRNVASSAEALIALQELREEWLGRNDHTQAARELGRAIARHAEGLPTTPARFSAPVLRVIRDHYADDIAWLRSAYGLEFSTVEGENGDTEAEQANETLSGGRVRELLEQFDPTVLATLRETAGSELGYLP